MNPCLSSGSSVHRRQFFFPENCVSFRFSASLHRCAPFSSIFCPFPPLLSSFAINFLTSILDIRVVLPRQTLHRQTWGHWSTLVPSHVLRSRQTSLCLPLRVFMFINVDMYAYPLDQPSNLLVILPLIMSL